MRYATRLRRAVTGQLDDAAYEVTITPREARLLASALERAWRLSYLTPYVDDKRADAVESLQRALDRLDVFGDAAAE